ncbi:hypothetical protein GCM10027262_62120 [Nocardia tengchongensis]
MRWPRTPTGSPGQGSRRTRSNADAHGTINGGAPNAVVVPVVAEYGKWKVQKEWTCTTLSLVNQTSPARS